ncbi:MAG: methionine--tRNA ligase [Bacteroidales bacterium]|nr:methionine--tRNA ligase [Lentimicrobiaceae bacterium]MDD5694575.1 methionine--tRNA ligase [Bacteroidales bacterium]
MSSTDRWYSRTTVTSALPYANGPLHIGHLAGVYIPADIYVRYLRSKGEDVLFIGGSDEHGVPITIKARQQGVTPQEIVDRYHRMIKDSFEEFGISFDIYSRTSNPVHHETAAGIFKTLYNKGEFIEKTTLQYFDEENQVFLADRYITGTCPRCDFPKAYGDQCENCGTSLSPDDLINPRSALSGKPPVKKETKHWYLPLDKYESWLKQWILQEHKDDWKPNVYGQCKSWLDHGLQPRAVTRDLDWGVKVPLPETEGKVLYVWFDAPIGYISATREWAALHHADWEVWWKAKDTRLLHFIGKDNIVFHCIIFPSMLYHEGTYIIPDNVPAFEFMNLEGDKISTSRNWAVWLHEYLKDFPGKQDVLRYALTTNAPETKDNDFTWKDFQARNNSELLAIFGNFINRTLVLTDKFFGNRVPPVGIMNEYDRRVAEDACTFPDRIGSMLDLFRFRDSLSELMNLARLGNKYLTDSEPWKLIKTDEARVGTILNISLQLCANLAILCEPFLPFSAARIRQMMNLPSMKWLEAGRMDILQADHPLSRSFYLFEKIEDGVVEAQVKKLQETKKINESPKPEVKPQKPLITYDDFTRMDIRLGTILEAKQVPGADKLLELRIDTGMDQRTVVAGIAMHYRPEEVVGRQVCFLVNLEPRKLRGLVSQGMILMAESPDGKLAFIKPEPSLPDGSDVK